MTNRRILKKYICGLLNRLMKSPDQVDKDIYKYLSKRFVKIVGIDEEIRRMGESPSLHWKHNVHPSVLRSLIREANKKRNEAGFARKAILKHVTA